MNVQGFEIEVFGVYKSNAYEMFVNHGGRYNNKEASKANYLSDPAKRLEVLTNLTKYSDDTKARVYVSRPQMPDWQGAGYDSIEDFFRIQQYGIFVNVSSLVSNKRRLEIELYLTNIFNQSDEILNRESDYKAICYLVDWQYKSHTKVLSDVKSDLAFRQQYRPLIYDFLQLKINAIHGAKLEDVGKVVKEATKKALKWNGKLSAIGTLFGMLHEEGVITGSKMDVARALSAMFGNLKESSVHDNVKLKVNKFEAKTYYDKETLDKVKSWIAYLSNSTPK